MKPAQPRRAVPRTYSKHGITALKRAVNGLGGRVIDMRTTLGRALAQWRGDLVADLGGRDAISTQQAAVIDLAVKTKLLLDSIDTWLLQQPSLINKRARAVLPVVRERQTLADALARYLSQLGLERRAKPVTDLTAYVRERYGSLAPVPSSPTPVPHDEVPGAPSPGAPETASPETEPVHLPRKPVPVENRPPERHEAGGRSSDEGTSAQQLHPVHHVQEDQEPRRAAHPR